MPSYRVIILARSGEVLTDSPVVAKTKGEAVYHATGEQLMRGDRGVTAPARETVR